MSKFVFPSELMLRLMLTNGQYFVVVQAQIRDLRSQSEVRLNTLQLVARQVYSKFCPFMLNSKLQIILRTGKWVKCMRT
jgi:hypothetical protein